MFASSQSNGNDYLQFYSELIVGTYKRMIKVIYEKTFKYVWSSISRISSIQWPR